MNDLENHIPHSDGNKFLRIFENSKEILKSAMRV